MVMLRFPYAIEGSETAKKNTSHGGAIVDAHIAVACEPGQPAVVTKSSEARLAGGAVGTKREASRGCPSEGIVVTW